MASISSFARSMRSYAGTVDSARSRVLREVGLRIDQTVVLATPVDTGRARSNWIVQIGSPSLGVREPFVPGAKGSTGPQNVQAALADAAGKIASVGPGDTIYLVNNLPYIGPLSRGSSPQADAGWIVVAVRTAVAGLAGVRVLEE